MRPVAILPVVIKDLPISPRLTSYDFLSRCKLSTLTTRQLALMVEFYLLLTITHVVLITLSAINSTDARTKILLTRIELTTSALLAGGVQVTR